MINMLKDNAGWLLNRLRCMSFPEVIHRTGRQLSILREKRNLPHVIRADSRPPAIVTANAWIHPEVSAFEIQPYAKAANLILDDHVDIFRREIDTQTMIDAWNQNPLSLKQAPMVYGKDLNYRDEDLVGDIKYLWEPNRHLHLVPIGQAYYLSRQELYLKAIMLHVRSWIEQCPYLMGPNWSSSLEVAIRLINWSITWQLVGGAESKLFSGQDGEAFRTQWLSSIHQHMAYISKHFSKYSSANNHLIGEAAGLFIGANTWPYWGGITDKWRSTSHGILCDEAQKQIYFDGGTREQAMSYQQFVLDFLILSFLSGKYWGMPFPEPCKARILSGMEFLRAMLDCRGNMPMIGDADDGYVVNMSPDPDFCPYRSLLATGTVLFKRPDLLPKDQPMDDKTRWLVGASEDTPLPESETDSRPRCVFPSSGYYILGEALETEDETRCVIDCGPLGYLSIAAHGHADALAIYLSIGGNEFLIDPGTYCYHTRPRWRAYFKGTSAHNTARVDGVDQSVSGGNFMWIRKARAHTDRFDTSVEKDIFEGRHDGYRRLEDPVTHTRNVMFEKKENTIYVTDTFKCRQKHYVERFWHFHEECAVTLNKNVLYADNNGSKIIVSPVEETRVGLHRGNDDLPLGWVSRHYDLKVPSYTAVFSNAIVGTTKLQTQIRIKK